MTKAIFKNLSKSEQKARMISTGNRMERLVCLMCGKNQFIESTNKNQENAHFADTKGIALQVVYGGVGKGTGFWLHKPECLTLKQMKQNQKYSDLLKKIKEQCELILEGLE